MQGQGVNFEEEPIKKTSHDYTRIPTHKPPKLVRPPALKRSYDIDLPEDEGPPAKHIRQWEYNF